MKPGRFAFNLMISLLAGLLAWLAMDRILIQRGVFAWQERSVALAAAGIATAYLMYLFLGDIKHKLEQIKSLDRSTSFVDRVKTWLSTIPGQARSFLSIHWPGLILASGFFIILTYLGVQLNQPGLDTTDNFLDADNSTWMLRISGPRGDELEMRAPHPFAYLIFRPLGWIANAILSDPFLAAELLNTSTGAACVFLTWMIVSKRIQNKTYALLFAALLGASTSHLWLGAIVETYIFSAAALLIFFLLLQSDRRSNTGFILAGLMTFGITLTNVVQIFIGFFTARPNLKNFLRFATVLLAGAILLTSIHYALYPSARTFLIPSQALSEEEFSISILREPAWRAVGRTFLVARTVLLYTLIAPRPFVFSEAVGGTFPRFNFFRIAPGEFAFSSYDGIGTILVLAWVGILLFSGFMFIRKVIREHRLDMTFAFACCLLFNFLLHLNYGYEPFLYSPDWAFALILFVALALGEYATKRWLHIFLGVFLLLLALNQWQFFNFVLEVIAPYLS